MRFRDEGAEYRRVREGGREEGGGLEDGEDGEE